MHKTKVCGASIISILSLMSLLTTGVALFNNNTNKAEASTTVTQGSSSDLATTINLHDQTNDEIKSYYSSLNGKSANELQGTNLLKNLREIIHNLTYYNYDTAWKIYEISDRDWSLSPASSASGTYDASNETITGYTYGTSTSNTGSNPYVHAMYREHDNSSGYIQAWSDHSAAGINREHVWCNSRGFDDKDNNKKGPAYNDIHHLMAADGNVNQALHNNYPFGYVSTASSIGKYEYNDENKLGTSTFDSSASSNVFEPQDCDKGDIARACFYMAACYNNYSGNETISNEDPFLAMENAVTDKQSAQSSSTTPVTMGVLHDLLLWHKLDPVDDYEIHRNNLIYNNYQYNRNPFVDYPEWVDYIWGIASGVTTYDATPTGYADLSKDVINGYRSSSTEDISISLNKTKTTITVGNSETLVATCSHSSATISWKSANTAIATVNNGVVTGVKAGSTTISASVTINGTTYSASCAVTVSNASIAVSGISLDKTSLSLDLNGTKTGTITATITPNNATNQNITWLSTNSAVASVNNGLVTALSEGSTNITATTDDGKFTASCAVMVTNSSSSETIGTYSISFKTNSSDSNTSLTTATINNQISVGSAYISEFTTLAKIYPGKSGIKFGTSSVIGDMAFTTSTTLSEKKIKSITLTGAQYGTDTGTLDLYVNGDATSVLSFTPSEGSATYTFDTATSVTSIEIKTSTARAYLSGITFSYVSEQEVIYPTSVSLDKTSLTIDLAGITTSQLSASVSPSNATDQAVIWSVDDSSIATISETGLVTGKAVGNATITATTHVGGFTATCKVSVINSGDSSETPNEGYYEKIDYTDSLSSGTYVIASPYNNAVYGMSNTITSDKFTATALTVANNQITASDGANYAFTITVSSTSATIQTSAGYVSYTGNSTSMEISSTAYSYTISQGSNGGAFTFTTSDNRGLRYSKTYSAFKAYTKGSSNYDLDLYKYVDDSTTTYTASKFVSDFNTAITCDETGVNSPAFASGYSWNVLKNKFNSLSQDVQSTFTNASYTIEQIESGSDIQKVVARYDYIVSKYGYENFMNRAAINNGKLLLINESNNNGLITIMVVSLVILSTSLIYIVRKKKEQ